MAPHVDTRCKAFQTAIDTLGRPWTAQILNVLQDGPLRFCGIGDRLAGIGDKVLSARLKELEGRGLLTRSVDPGPPVKVAYELTALGRSFNDVAKAIHVWGAEMVAAEKG
jgi:DNA-binding HxlR family transcriptional regulator